MRLRSLRVTDYRGFEGTTLEFEPSLTVLVGVNGSGKTGLLDAVARMLSYLVAGVRSGRAAGARFREDDIRNGTKAATARLTASFAPDVETSWEVSAVRPGHPRRENSLSELHPVIAATQESIERGTPALPLAVYFPTNRNALDIPDRIRERHAFEPITAYDGALEAGERNFRTFFEWFREEEDQENALFRRSGASIPKNSPINVVRQAIKELLPGVDDIHIERKPQRMVLTKGSTRLDVRQLSDGEKCTLAMFGDLARRMAIAAPDAPRPLAMPVVVLIDEIELHLHPGLQRAIIPGLQRVFPSAQIVASTHSPQVLASVHAESVRLLDRFQVQRVERQTWRRDTNQILDAVFADPGRPSEVAAQFATLRKAIDADRFDEARRVIGELRAALEGDDPEVRFYESLLPPEFAIG